MAEVTEQIVREAPEVEAYKLGLLQAAKGLADQPVNLPAQQIAALSPLQQMAFGSAETGVGAYLPYLQGAGYTLGDAQTALGGVMAGATPYQQEALYGLRQAGAAIPLEVGAAQRGLQGAIEYGAQTADRARAGAMGIGAQALPQFGQATQTGIGAYQTALQGLSGTTGQFDPSQIATYQSPYEDIAVQQALADIARQGQIQQQALGAQAVSQGAFGGSRQAIAQQELARNVLEQQGRTAAQMRAAGFESAAQRAQQAAVQGGQFGLNTAQLQAANAQAMAQTGMNLEQLSAQTGMSAADLAGRYAQQAGALGITGQQTAGQLAQGIGGLGVDYSQLGLQQGEALGTLGLRQASLGQQTQQLGQQQAGFLFDLGQKQQQQQQAELEAARQTQLQQAYEPYQRVGFLSDIYKGAPTTQQSITAGTTPTTSAAEKFLGLGIAGLSAAAGASKAGLF